jgi:hypothetical protein
MQSSKLSRVLPAQNQRLLSAAYYSSSKQSSRHKGHLKRAVIEEKQYEERKNTLLGPKKQYPFPGDVLCAPNSQFHRLFDEAEIGSKTPRSDSINVQSLERRYSISIRKLLDELLNPVRRADNYEPPTFVDESTKCARKVELRVFPCPKLLKIGMRKVFVDLAINEMTVLNLTQKSDCSTTADSDQERIQLSYTFVEAASAICEGLKSFGHWADFIDPRSGKPYYSNVQGKLFDSDRRYHHLGFSIDDVGSCDIINSVNWSGAKFVGTIFTSAPYDCQLVKQIVREVNREDGEEDADEEHLTNPIRH